MTALNTYVAVAGPDNTTVWFGPGDELPDWAAAAITNPDVWDKPQPEDSPEISKGDADAVVSQPRRRGRPPRAAAEH